MKTILFSIILLLVILAAVASFVAPNLIGKTKFIDEQSETAPTDTPKVFVTNEKRKPVIVELFTSEGCSSCPNADKNLSMLEREQPIANAEIVALSEHVDYWNRLGWNDPFSSRQFSSRQGEYSQFFGKNGDVYTPQMIVDGNRELPGHDMRAALKAITESANNAKGDVELRISKISNDLVSLDIKVQNLPKISGNDNAIILLAVTENDVASSVVRGENAGRQLTHAGVVRHLQNIGNAINEEKTYSAVITLGKDWKQQNLNVVAFVQETESRKILGANKISLKS
jgi:hypothetical protein